MSGVVSTAVENFIHNIYFCECDLPQSIDDIMAWSLLALSIALIHAAEPLVGVYIFLSVLGYSVFLLVGVRPVWGKLIDYVDRSGSQNLQNTLLAFNLLFVFASAWVTEVIGMRNVPSLRLVFHGLGDIVVT